MFRRAILQSTRTFTPAAAAESTYSPAAAVFRLSRFQSRQRVTCVVPSWRGYSTEQGSEVKPGNGSGDGNGNGNGNGNGAAAEQQPEATKGGDTASELLAEFNKCKADLEAKAKEASDLKDKFLRSVADFRNLQDRTEREIRSAKDFAISKFARDLVETVDNMDLALNAVPEASRASADPEKKDLVDLYNGLKMTEGILLNTLKRHGLEKVVPLGEKFDPNLHEATFQAKVEGKEPGTVFHVMRTGFMLNGRVVRAAQVGVVQKAE